MSKINVKIDLEKKPLMNYYSKTSEECFKNKYNDESNSFRAGVAAGMSESWFYFGMYLKDICPALENKFSKDWVEMIKEVKFQEAKEEFERMLGFLTIK